MSNVIRDNALAPKLQTNGTTFNQPFVIGAGAKALLVCVHIRDADVSGVPKAGGVDMVLVGDQVSTTGVPQRTAVFKLANPPTGTVAITGTLTNNPTVFAISAYSAANTDLTAPFGASSEAHSSGTTVAPPAVATAAGDMVVGFLTGNGDFAPAAGQTEITPAETAANFNPELDEKLATSSSTSMSWSLGFSRDYAAIVVVIKAPANTAPTVAIDQKSSIGSSIPLPETGQIQLSATITDPDAADAGLSPTWASDTPAVATVDASTGLVTAVAEGQAVITASTTDTAGAPGSDSVTIVVDNTPGAGTTLILEDEMQQEVRQAGVATKVRVALFDTSGVRLTSNPLASGDVTVSINDAAPVPLAGGAGLAAIAMVNGLLPIPLAAAELPSAGDRVTLLIQDQDGTAYRAKSVEILASNYAPAVAQTASDIAAAVWSAGTRSLTTFGTLVSDVVSGVWGAGARTLTAFSDSAGVTTLLARLTAARAALLDFLDAAISTRLAGSTYTAPDNAGIASANATLATVQADAAAARAAAEGASTFDPATDTVLANVKQVNNVPLIGDGVTTPIGAA